MLHKSRLQFGKLVLDILNTLKVASASNGVKFSNIRTIMVESDLFR